jgi:2,4-dienoyl-CoA reductase (NADPH2)
VEYRRGKVSPTELRIDNHKFIPALNDLAEVIRENGAKAAVQLHHVGRQSNLQITEGVELVSASDSFCSVTGGQARALQISEIDKITEAYAGSKGEGFCHVP